MSTVRSFIDVHVLQTVPPSCLNRDDTNSPKSALYGGTRRARVSSQSWKRATRRYFNEQSAGVGHGVRTRKLPEMLAGRLRERLGSQATAHEARIVALSNTASGLLVGVNDKKLKKMTESTELVPLEYALFISASAIESALDQLQAAIEGAELDAEALKQAMGRGHSLDVALFGRMIADTPELNVDAACQVAHAISTHRVAAEFDFYTTVDDLAGADESGAAMMGYVEFNSATLYRYATVSLGALADNLGDPTAVSGGVRAFVEGFVRSLPTGRQNTFGAMTLPELVFVSLRDDQPVSLVGAFESPVEATEGYVTESARRLAAHATGVDALYGSPRVDGWAAYLPSAGDLRHDLGVSVAFPDLLDGVEEAVRAQMAP
jgi:CRISPR system Cascade subunit CasC